jgi:hypothetical protein
VQAFEESDRAVELRPLPFMRAEDDAVAAPYTAPEFGVVISLLSIASRASGWGRAAVISPLAVCAGGPCAAHVLIRCVLGHAEFHIAQTFHHFVPDLKTLYANVTAHTFAQAYTVMAVQLHSAKLVPIRVFNRDLQARHVDIRGTR